MPRRPSEDSLFHEVPRERRSQKLKRYLVALTIATVLAASLLVIASIIGIAIAPLFERSKSVETTEVDPESQ